MEKNLLIHKLNSTHPDALLEVSRFGKSDTLLAWIVTPALLEIGRALKEDQKFNLVWLENLSVADLDGVIVVSYFLRSNQVPPSSATNGLVLRISEEIRNGKEKLRIPSIKEIWPMAEPMENEVQEMFGISFSNEQENHILPEGIKGHPLRKDFVFPKELQGIQHERDHYRVRGNI